MDRGAWQSVHGVARVGHDLATKREREVCHSFCSKEQVSFNFMAAVTICSEFGAKKIKSVTVSIVSPSICQEVMGSDAMIFVF